MTDIKLKPFEEMEFHPISQKLVEVLQVKTQNSNPLFFQVLLAYYFGVIAGQMRTSISGMPGKGTIPVNVYAFNLSPSGTGKGHSTSIIEYELLNNFKQVFTEHTFPLMAETNLDKLAIQRVGRSGGDYDQELEKLRKNFNDLGAVQMCFDSAGTAAIKQMRQKLLMANAGACNLQVDEIGANFSGSIEALNTYLELFDKGNVKDRLLKSTAESVRFEKIEGSTPANLLLFGAPSKLLDGGTTESQLMEVLEMGLARRCFFGYAATSTKIRNPSAKEVMAQLFDTTHDTFMEDLSAKLAKLADVINMNKVVHIPEKTMLYLLEYRINCESRSAQLNERSETLQKAELEHRYFKSIKLAGAYAFIDGSPEITIDHLENAIKLAEESGKAFINILTPERPYIKLARYLAESKAEVTLADLDEDLPSFKGSKSQKEEMIMMAIAWGYKNNIIIKRVYNDGILFLHGETIEKTDLDKMVISYGTHEAFNYISEEIPFTKLPQLFGLPDYHWLNHKLVNGEKGQGHRNGENIRGAFNLLVLDVDDSIDLSTAQLLLQQYTAIYYTTKRHTAQENRFRVVIPLSYTVKMDEKEYKEFYDNIIAGLPFKVDDKVGQRCKKWLTNPGQVIVNQGELFDVLPYIPKTSKNEERAKLLHDQASMDNLERWMVNNTGTGNRNSMLNRYSLILVDAGFNFEQIRTKILELNNKLQDKLDETEIASTILQTTVKALAKRNP